MAASTDGDGVTTPKITVFRKYANRRLYDTSRARCVTLADIARHVRKGEMVKIVEAKSGSDVTRQILAQILCDIETGPAGLLDETVLMRLIGLSGKPDTFRVNEILNRALDRLDPNTSGHLPTRMPLPPRARNLGEIRAVTARIEALQTRLQALVDSTDAGIRRATHTPKKD